MSSDDFRSVKTTGMDLKVLFDARSMLEILALMTPSELIFFLSYNSVYPRGTSLSV